LTQSSTVHIQIPFKELVLEKQLGEGGYGKVYLGKWRSIPVALKFCRQKGKIEDFMKEVKLMV
jgi:predicted Ser/Thr protein kinase